MSYMHIDNLYKNQKILLFRECYALEKVHGTSAHITFTRNPGQFDSADLDFFSGGASHELFVNIFDKENLKAKFLETEIHKMTVYGEAYGGSMQRMSHTYGAALRFIAFEVHIGEIKGGECRGVTGKWLDVPTSEKVVQNLGLEFVPYERVSTDLTSLDAERDRPSRVAVRRGITEPKIAEGVVLRPLLELKDHQGGRIIAKHKRPEFSERASKKDTVVDPAKQEVLDKAEAIAAEWVVVNRLEHVLDGLRGSLGREPLTQDTRMVIDAMVEDVLREAKGEIVSSKEVIKAIGRETVKLFLRMPQKATLDV